MNILASIELDFLGSRGFAWWALILCSLGVALIAYGVVQRRRLPASSAGPAPDAADRTMWLAVVTGVASIVYGLGAALLPMMRAAPIAMVFMLAVSGMAVWLFYRRMFEYLGRFRLGVLFALRVLAVIALLLLLFKPVLAFIKRPHHVNTVGIVVDASGSMSVSDQPNEPSRYLQSTLAARILMTELGKQVRVKCFAYDGKHNGPLASADEWNNIPPNGTVTDLPTAIKIATDNGCRQVVLFSDGIQNGPSKISSLASGSVPVYTVRVGSTATQAKGVPDIQIVRVDGPQTAPVDTEVTLTAVIRSTALNDRTVEVYLQQNKATLMEHRLVLQSGPTPQLVHLKFTPHKVGRVVLNVHIPVVPEERTSAGNQQQFPMLITNPQIRVLYLEGRVRPEVGPLRNVLQMDPNINLVSMIRTRPNYFLMHGIREGDHLIGVPTTLKQWEMFKVIILGDESSRFLSAEQQQDIKTAIEHGSGFLMIGGQHNFAAGDWGESVLGPAFPINLEVAAPAQISLPFVPQLTAFGAQSPIFQGIGEWFIGPAGTPAQKQLPPLAGCVAFAGAKPGATVLLTHPTALVNGRPAVVLAVEHYGKGRTAAFAADTTFRWQLMLRTMGDKSPYNRFWGQLIRWLAGESKVKTSNGPSVTVMIRKERYEPNEPVRLRVAVTDMHGQSTRYAHVQATITGPDGKTRMVDLTARQSQVGMYYRNIMPRGSGKYHVSFVATKDHQKLGTDATDFYVMAPGGEMDKLAAEPSVLQRIARLTGGSYTELAGVGDLARIIKAALPPTAQVQRSSFALYNNRAFFLIFIGLMTAEWYFRRKWQLQ
ncbi:MAG: hypothetical protein HKL96_12655 [Phycisphaerales bacterium]|nr:hypothetical protein [Phycisphaerales bacterium]